MKQPAGHMSRIGAFRSLLHRFAFLALVMAAFGLMLIGKADTILVERMRTTVGDALTPMLDILSRPAANVADLVDTMRKLVAVRAENVRLKDENDRLLQWQSVARQLEAENKGLRDLLNFSPGPSASFISGRVIAVTDGPFVRAALLNVGSRDGVRKGQAVLTGQGLVGRVDRVGSRAASILLITDLNSKIPVIVEPSRNRAILVSNKGRLQLIYMMGNGHVSVGDRVVTAADANAFPPDVPVGMVTRADDAGVEIEPFVRPSAVEYVRLVDFGLSGILQILDPEDGEGP